MWFCKLWRALLYSVSGLRFLLEERAFVQEILLGVVLFPLICFSKNSTIEIMYIFSSYCLVLITESLNTGIETAVNRISEEQNPISKKAKDIGSASVFLALLHLVAVICVTLKF